MKYVLDTDHVSILERKAGADYAVLVVNLNNHIGDGIGISAPTFHEQVLGAHDRIIQAKNATELLRGYEILTAVLDLHRNYPLLPYSAAAHAEWTRLKAQKVRVGTMDLRIASVALSQSLTLVTRNVADFGKVPNLAIIDWTR